MSDAVTSEDRKFWVQFESQEFEGDGRGSAFAARYPVKQYERSARVDTLEHYGGGKLACVRCGFSDIRALTLDHINGRGKEPEKRRLWTGNKLYVYLRRVEYPDGYQTLCMNCQFIKAKENREYRSF